MRRYACYGDEFVAAVLGPRRREIRRAQLSLSSSLCVANMSRSRAIQWAGALGAAPCVERCASLLRKDILQKIESAVVAALEQVVWGEHASALFGGKKATLWWGVRRGGLFPPRGK